MPQTNIQTTGIKDVQSDTHLHLPAPKRQMKLIPLGELSSGLNPLANFWIVTTWASVLAFSSGFIKSFQFYI
jgi:hypothetical protein